MSEHYDYIVIGAGSAGCVVVRRLIDAGKRVLLLEAGPSDDTMFVKMPATFIRVIGSKRSWLYKTEPQAHAKNRCMYVPQGRMLGGSSSLNAMVYIRGTAQDYDDWAASGCAGWSWSEVLPAFKKSENNQVYANQWHGNAGLLTVSTTKFQHPLSQAFIRAAQQAGLPHNADFNGQAQAGVGFYQTTTHDGRRGSTAELFLRPIEHHVNLTVKTDALVERLLFKNKRVIGVVYSDTGNTQHTAHAIEEVILSAGALASPKILLLSGIGNQADLKALNIECVHDLKGVGHNFHDHLEVPVFGRIKQPISLLGSDKGFAALKHGLQWQLFKTGLLTSNVVESGGFVDTTGSGRPDIQFHVLPTLVGDADRPPMAGHGISINPCFLRPKSRGQVQLRSSNPIEPILFDGGFLSHPDDLETLLRGLKWARKILRSPALQAYVSEELGPSADENVSDDVLSEWILARCKTVYHPAGTCKMGVDDMAVVDTQLRVHGVTGLRVADASIIPILPSGNTNAPSIMIGERCAEFILNKG